MGKRLTLMLTALLAVATVIFVIISIAGQNNLEDNQGPDFNDMSRTELTALMVVNPNKHEARALLALMDLREGDAPTALQNMLILAWANWDMSSLESELETQIRNNPSQADSCLTMLKDQRSSWLWPKEMSVMIGTIAGKGNYVLDNLPALLSDKSDHPLALRALEEFLKTDILVAWDIGVMLGSKYSGQVVNSIVNLPLQQHELVNAISEKHPDNKQARLLGAYLSGGDTGLDGLLHLEEEGLEPWDPRQYSKIKLSLIYQASPEITEEHLRYLDFSETVSRANQAVQSQSVQDQSLGLELLFAMEKLGHQPRNINEYSSIKYLLLQTVVPHRAHELTVTPEFFQFIQPGHMLYLIENWQEKLSWAGFDEHGLMQAINFAADTLAQEPGWSHISSIINPPFPPAHKSVLDSEHRKDQGQIYQLSLSPDANHIIYFTSNTIWWYDLKDEEYRQVQTMPQAGDYSVYWTPDSRTFVLERQHPETNNAIQFFATNHTDVSEFDIGQATVLGWQNNSTLLITSKVNNVYRVSRVNAETGQTQAVTTQLHPPVLTSAGRIAWTETSAKTLTISIQGVESKYSLPKDLVITDWLPGDRGVLLQSSSKDYYILDFATNSITEIQVKGSFTPYAWTWRGDNTIYGIFSLGLLNHVLLLDLEDMSLSHTGILSYHGDFSGSKHYWHIHSSSIYIYNLDNSL